MCKAAIDYIPIPNRTVSKMFKNPVKVDFIRICVLEFFYPAICKERLGTFKRSLILYNFGLDR